MKQNGGAREGQQVGGSGEFSSLHLKEAEGVSGIQLSVVALMVNLPGLLGGLESAGIHFWFYHGRRFQIRM